MPAVVQPGRPLGLTYELENVSAKPIDQSEFPPAYPTRVEAGDGSVWDTAVLMNHSWPYTRPTSLEPGAVTTVDPMELAVQFPGPLTVTPTCAREEMPALSVAVDEGGPAPSPADAVERATSATPGLFDQCMPVPDASVVGTITPPADSKLTPVEARCDASATSFSSFAVVTFAITMPPDAPSVQAPDGILGFGNTADAPEKNAEVVFWRFVVVDDEAFPVASSTSYSTRSGDAFTTGYEVSGAGWSSSDSSRCGGTGYASGGSGESAYVVFFDACRADSTA